jgi:hypothetical protein
MKKIYIEFSHGWRTAFSLRNHAANYLSRRANLGSIAVSPTVERPAKMAAAGCLAILEVLRKRKLLEAQNAN